MIKLLTAATGVFLLATFIRCQDTYITSIQTNYRNDTDGITYSRYYCSDGCNFVDTSNKYTVWQHIDR